MCFPKTQMEVVTYLRQLQPNQTKDTILQALKAFTTMTGMSEPMVQGLVWRVLEIVHTYATSKLKPDHPMQSKIYCNDAVAEMALGEKIVYAFVMKFVLRIVELCFATK